MLSLACLLLSPAATPPVDGAAFPKGVRAAAANATVRVVNVEKQSEGSGVILGRRGHFVYVLTASHVVGGTDRVEVATFSEKSAPKAHGVYRSVRLVAKADGVRD